ncbi:MAG: hypothetical protein K0R21_129 [Anaerocolumna sp.]|nr:hypothetical protein [Anaerocolumna sp.]
MINRGNHKSDIFREEEDYRMFLKLLEKAQKQYTFFIISYCLMTNHVHLQIETSTFPIWDITKYLFCTYSHYFNRKYDEFGHLFQGRYNSEIIDDDAYYLETSRYIHLNPVKAHIVTKPIDYPWSSYSAYMGASKCSLVSEGKILEYFSKNSRSYKEFVEAR